MNMWLRKGMAFLLVISISIIGISFTNVAAEGVKRTNTSTVKKITLNKSNIFLELDQSNSLTVEFEPLSSAKVARVVWTTSDSKVATVHNGTINAKGLGTAYVYATSDKAVAFCKVTVIRYNPVRAVQNKNYTGYSGTDLEVVTKAADIIDSTINSGMNDEDKIRAIHGYLLRNCEFYNLGLHNAKTTYYGLVGTLLEKTAVFEGYAYTFKYLMDILDVKTRIWQKKVFMWNEVYLNDFWFKVAIPVDELSGNERLSLFDPRDHNISKDIYNNYKDAVIHNEVDFEYILSEYGDGSYSGNQAAIDSYLIEKDSSKAQEYTVMLDPNFSFDKHFNLTNSAVITESIQESYNYVPNYLPYIKNTPNVYVSSFNTKPDGSGISYPYNFVKEVKENLYLYCIWSADIDSVRLKLTASKGSITANWSKANGCKGFELRYSTDSSMKNAVTKNYTGQKAKISNLKQKTTYYVQVRGYITDDDGKITYGNWSIKNKIMT